MNPKRFILIVCFMSLTIRAQDTIIDSDYDWETLKATYTLHYYKHLTTANFKQFQSGIAQMSLVDVSYYGYDHKVHRGQIVCHQSVAEELQSIFRQLLWIKFPISSVIPMSEFNFDDHLSMHNNNTTCFDFRLKTLKNGWSKHAYGIAIDLNPRQNPFVSRQGVFPDNALSFLSQGRIRADDFKGMQVIRIFAMYGWRWGGYWSSSKDYMHFQKNSLPAN
ncbi:MAG: hypothetical protein CR968_04235 [Flavobacteriia bacterium]|nr:MAG: hypothetical protein CR968_04235 [Flavobacteriia bacterium]